MPYIDIKTSAEITAEKEQSLKARLGEAISLLPGKSESWLMLSFNDNCRMWFKGKNDKPIAYAHVKSFGSINPAASNKFTAAVCEIFASELGVAPEQTYVSYEETSLWGYNGSNF